MTTLARWNRVALPFLLLALLAGAPSLAATAADFDHSGSPQLKSIGPLAFAPDGVLFAADSIGAAVFAIETPNDGEVQKSYGVKDLVGQIAARLGTTADQLRIHDLAIHPKTKVAYLSVTRGQGASATAVVVRIKGSASGEGKIDLLSLDNVRYSRAELDNAPDPNAKDRRGRSQRQESITDLDFSNGQLLVTGLSNEEFSSKLRKLDFPFRSADAASVEIYHGAHGRWETHAPIRTLTTYEIEDTDHVLAAYTCTPLVTFPVADLIDNAKVTGKTVAELGNRNRPLDMFVYEQKGEHYLLVANSSRGVMKVDLNAVEDGEGIVERIAGTAGLKYKTIEGWTGVTQLARFDRDHAMLVVEHEGKSVLKVVELP